MNVNTRNALKAAHSPAARRKATATLMAMTKAREQIAQRYDESPGAFTKAKLLKTIERLGITPRDLPPILLRPFGKRESARLLNGAATNGASIPLEAIPARKATGGAASRYSSNKARNIEVIGKVLDLLANPKTSEKVAERLVAVLDKLLA